VAKAKKQHYSKFNTPGFLDRVYALWRQGLGPLCITNALKKAGDKASRNTITKLLAANRNKFAARAAADDKAEQAAGRALAVGDDPKLQRELVDLNVGVFRELQTRLPDMETDELVTLANGLICRTQTEIFRAAQRSLASASAGKLQALVLGNLIAHPSLPEPKDLDGGEIAKILSGHESGDLLRNVRPVRPAGERAAKDARAP
jgi:hypothetical protein